MSPARYAWRGSLFCSCFSVARCSCSLARRACADRSLRSRRAVDCLDFDSLALVHGTELPSWFPRPTVPAVRWAGRHGGAGRHGAAVRHGWAEVTPAHGFGRCARRSAPSGWVTRGDGGDVDRFGWVSACLHPRFVFQCLCCRVAFCSLLAVRSLCRWQGFALAMVGTT